MGPSPNSQPSTPSTHTPGDGVAVPGNLQHVNMPKSLMMYGADGTGGLASSSNQLVSSLLLLFCGCTCHETGFMCLSFMCSLLTTCHLLWQEDMDHFGDVESFLSHDDGEARDIFSTLKRSPAEHNTESSKGNFLALFC